MLQFYKSKWTKSKQLRRNDLKWCKRCLKMKASRSNWLQILSKSSRNNKSSMDKNHLNKTRQICNLRSSLSTSNLLKKSPKVLKRQEWWVKCIKLNKNSKLRSLYLRSNWIRNRTRSNRKMSEKYPRWIMESQTISLHFRIRSEIWINSWPRPEKSVTRDKAMSSKCSRLRPSSKMILQYYRSKWTKSKQLRKNDLKWCKRCLKMRANRSNWFQILSKSSRTTKSSMVKIHLN